MARKIVVLGTAHNHVYGIARGVAGARDCELAGVWDEDPQRLEGASERLGGPAFSSLDEALKADPALVLIGAVPCDRAGLARRAIEAGAAALVDKPLAVTHEALDRTIEAVGRFDKPVITYYPYRGQPSIRAARKALDAGRIGKLVRVLSCGPHKLSPHKRPAWHWTRAGNGGCMIDVGSHHADICCWFAGQAPDYICSVHANSAHPDHPEFQDFAQAHLRFPSGVLAHVEADWFTPDSMKSFGDTRTWIQGSTGKIEIREGDLESAEIWTEDEAQQPLDTTGFPDTGQWSSTLIEALCEGRPCAIPQDEVWRASRVTLHAFDSAEAGGKPIDPPRY